jgi:enamine deaminase RidA (YjgF/YER057c/UK114 family)
MSNVEIERYRSESSNLPFSEAVRVGNVLYLSGQIGLDSSGKLVSGGIAAETRQTLENIKIVLGKYGSSIEQVVKCVAEINRTIAKEIIRIASEGEEFGDCIPTTDQIWGAYGRVALKP